MALVEDGSHKQEQQKVEADPQITKIKSPSNNFLWLADVARKILSAVVVLICAVLIATEFQPQSIIQWYTGPGGSIYISSPGVYTRERLVNDRNDQDYWLRQQLKALDNHSVKYSIQKTTTGNFGSAKDDNAENKEPAAIQPLGLQIPGIQQPVNFGAVSDDKKPEDSERLEVESSALSFIDTFAVRSAARDALRQGVLENLLDDRHDLTGNSVYGLKFDTSIFPGRFTTGRAYVRLSISINAADVIKRSQQDSESVDLPAHVASYYRLGDVHLIRNESNPFYSSKRLYDQWLENVNWRLNTHFQQITEKKCFCESSNCGSSLLWSKDILQTINAVLATNGARIQNLPPEVISSSSGDSNIQKPVSFVSLAVLLPAPWQNLLQVTVSNATMKGCDVVPSFNVAPVVDAFVIMPKDRDDQQDLTLFTVIDDKDAAFGYMPTGGDQALNFALYGPHYPVEHILKFLKDEKSEKFKGGSCDPLVAAEQCTPSLEVPSGYFNFIEKVIDPDMYAYSIFPRMDGSAALIDANTNVDLRVPQVSESNGSWFNFGVTRTTQEATLVPHFVGFSDSRAQGTIDFGWVVDIPSPGQAFQKSQFALISVPAWTSKLTVHARSGWLDRSSEELAPTADYNFDVPLPPDFEAFDAFIGGKEAVRRPKISDELMETTNFLPCQRNILLVPGFRLWRSAMVTVGSEVADKITVLPNMRGIIAEFPPSNSPVTAEKRVVRVWTSEGMDSVRDVVVYTQQANCNQLTSPEQHLQVEGVKNSEIEEN